MNNTEWLRSGLEPNTIIYIKWVTIGNSKVPLIMGFVRQENYQWVAESRSDGCITHHQTEQEAIDKIRNL